MVPEPIPIDLPMTGAFSIDSRRLGHKVGEFLLITVLAGCAVGIVANLGHWLLTWLDWPPLVLLAIVCLFIVLLALLATKWFGRSPTAVLKLSFDLRFAGDRWEAPACPPLEDALRSPSLRERFCLPHPDGPPSNAYQLEDEQGRIGDAFVLSLLAMLQGDLNANRDARMTKVQVPVGCSKNPSIEGSGLEQIRIPRGCEIGAGTLEISEILFHPDVERLVRKTAILIVSNRCGYFQFAVRIQSIGDRGSSRSVAVWVYRKSTPRLLDFFTKSRAETLDILLAQMIGRMGDQSELKIARAPGRAWELHHPA